MTAIVHIGVQWIVWGGLLTVLAGIGAAGLVLIARRLMPKERREAEVEAIGFVFAVVGVLYAIVLAFVVIDVWAKMTVAENEAYREVRALIEQYRYAETLAEPERSEIQRLSTEYVNHVLVSEWPRMGEHQRPGIEGDGLIDQMRDAVVAAQPEAQGGEPAYEAAIEQGRELAAAREARLATAVSGVPAVLWFVLIGGGLLMISFVYVFDVAGVVTQAILAIGLTVMTVLLLWSVYQMEYPFARQLRIDPSAFEYALARFAQITRGG